MNENKRDGRKKNSYHTPEEKKSDNNKSGFRSKRTPGTKHSEEKVAFSQRDSRNKKPDYTSEDKKSDNDKSGFRSKRNPNANFTEDKAVFSHQSEGNHGRHEKGRKTIKTPGGYRAHAQKKKTQELVRLNKFISNAGYCSRREADTLISSGVVSVNGVVVTELGYKVPPDAIVKVDKQTLKQEKYRYLLLNKPKDVITTCDDPQGRMTVLQLVKSACKERVYPVGRLDRNTTGLLILTNDGDFAKMIAHPSSRVKKLYEVTLDKRLKEEHFDEIAKGVWLDEKTFVDVDDLAFAEGVRSGTVLGIEIHSGKYHVVKRIFEKFGYQVLKLDRTKIDVLTKKDLPRGRWRFLTDSEINLLKRH